MSREMDKRPYPYPVVRARAEFDVSSAVQRTFASFLKDNNKLTAVHAFTSAERVIDKSQEYREAPNIRRADVLLGALSGVALRLSRLESIQQGRESGMRLSFLTQDTEPISRIAGALDLIGTIDNPPPFDLRLVIELAQAALHPAATPERVGPLLESHLRHPSAAKLTVTRPHLVSQDFAMYNLNPPRRPQRRR